MFMKYKLCLWNTNYVYGIQIMKINQKFEIFWKYSEDKSDWKVQWGIPMKMCDNWGQMGCLKSYWYSILLPLRCKWVQKYCRLYSKSPILTLDIEFASLNNHFWLKIVILNLLMINKYFLIICIWTEVKKYTNNFSDTPFGPNYSRSSNASITAPFHKHNFQCIF